MPNEQWAPLTLARVTSQPSDAIEGSIWYRTDLDQIRASDGGSGTSLTIGPYGTHPVIRSGAYHSVPPTGDVASANVPDGRMFAVPFWPGRTCTITAMAVNTTLALVGGNIRMGIYASDGVLPTTLLADFGTISSGILGVREITGLSTVVRPVLHYMVIGRQGGLLNLGLTTQLTVDPIVSETTPVFTPSLSSYYQTGIGGALPASFGTPAGTDQGPAIRLKLT